MGDEMGSHDVVFVKGPPGNEVEGLSGDALATNLPIEPVEGLCSTEPFFEVEAYLADASVSRGERYCKAAQPVCPLLRSPCDPLPRSSFGHVVGHEGESWDVWVLARLGDIRRIVDTEHSQTDPLTG
jgi:hypothetical protein